MDRQLTAHEQHILDSDQALLEATKLVIMRTPLREWPRPLQIPMNMALALGADDTRFRSNRVSAHRAKELNRFLARRGVIPDLVAVDDLENQPIDPNDAYIMDRLLADLVTKVTKTNYFRGN